MPSIYSEEFANRAQAAEKRIANIENTIDMHLAMATGTVEQAVTAVENRASFLETVSNNPNAAARVRQKIAAPEKLTNFSTVKSYLDANLRGGEDGFGGDYDFSSRLSGVMNSIAQDFPELDQEERLLLKQHVAGLFSGPGLSVDQETFEGVIGHHFVTPSSQTDGLTGTFAQIGNSPTFKTINYYDPGSIHSRAEIGVESPNAATLLDRIKDLYNDVQDANNIYLDTKAARRAEERHAARSDRVSRPSAS